MQKNCTKLMKNHSLFGLKHQTVTMSNVSSDKVSQSSPLKEVLPYESIPGPKPWPLIGNMLLFSKLGGFPLENFWDSTAKLKQKYGSVVKVVGVRPGQDMVWLFNPEDIRKMFQNEGDSPVRPPFDLLLSYRESNPQMSMGLVSGNGAEWKRLRKAIPTLLRLQTVSVYRQRQAKVAEEFVEAIRRSEVSTKEEGDSFLVRDVTELLFRYTLEAIGVVVLGKFQGCLQDNSTESGDIIRANMDFLTALGDSVFSLPLYRLCSTPTYLKLKRANECINRTIDRSLVELEVQYAKSPEEFCLEQPFLGCLLTNETLSREDKALLMSEIFMGGIDATATTTAFCFYFLSRSKEWQEKVYEELKHWELSEQNFGEAPILRGVLKESYRLRPSPSGVARILQKDTVIGGYLLKKGVLCQGIPFLSSRDPVYHTDPNSFNPGRWIRDQEEKKDGHPFSVLPFSHGVRMCPGRRLAEQEMMLAIAAVIKNFKLEPVSTSEKPSSYSSLECSEEGNPGQGFKEKGNPVQGFKEHGNPVQGFKEEGHSVQGFKEEGVGQVLRLNMMPDSPIAVRFIPRK